MSDVEVVPEASDNFITVALKGGCGEVQVDVDKIDLQAYKAMLALGVTEYINKNGMSKLLPGITKLSESEQAKRKAEVLKQAQVNIEALYSGEIKQTRAKASKVSDAVGKEALRLAKAMLKDLIRSAGQKLSSYPPKEQTAAAKLILEKNREELIKTAEKNLAERANAAKTTKALDLVGLFGEKALSEEVKAKKPSPPKRKGKGEAGPISAAAASKPAPRQRPGAMH